MQEGRYTITSVQRALTLLKLFDTNCNSMTLTEFSKLSGLHKSTILRLLATLTEEQFLSYDQEKKTYQLGIELFRLGNVVSKVMDLRKIARLPIDEAVKKTKLIAHLGILEQRDVVILEKVLPVRYLDSVSMVSKVGGIVPVHCTGIGKTLLAFREQQQVEALMEGYDYKKYSEKTITSFEQLRDEMKIIRERGFGINDGEHEPYIKCITFPIFDYSKQAVAAMSLTGLKEAIDSSGLDDIIATLREVTLDISFQLGYESK